MSRQPINVHKAFHAHIYFDQVSLDQARELCVSAGKKYGICVGRVHEKLVGPHPRWSCQLVFNTKQFDELVPWLETHRKDLTVLVHGLTGDGLKDHTEYAYWLGESVGLDLSVFSEAKA